MAKKLFQYEIPEFCMGEAIAEINRIGGLLLKLSEVNDGVTMVDVELNPEAHETYEKWLTELIAKGPEEFGPYCSFCGKGKDEVKTLIQGQNVYICDECVAVCQEVIENKSHEV